MTSNLDNLTYAELKQIAAMFGTSAPKPASSRVEGDMRPVIVRARDAGVHYGHLVAYEGRMVWLSNARRLWSWTAKSGVALNGVAMNGIVAAKSKVDVMVDNIIILDACEIIDCERGAAKTIEGA